jgi:putative heme-binding domain-containing protein
VAQAVLNSVDDADAQVQLQLAYSLGAFDDPRAAEALGQLAAKHSDDPYVLAGVWSSVGPNNIRSVSTRLLQGGQAERLPPSVVQTAVALAVRFGSPDDLVAIANSLAANNEGRYAAWQFDAAAKLLRSPARQEGSLADVHHALAPVVEAARRSLADGSGRDDVRLSAIRVLAAGETEPARILPDLALLLEPSNSPQVQLAAIDLIAAIPTKSAGETLLNAWRGFSPPARGRAFDVLFGKADLTNLLLEKLSAGEVDQADLDAVQRQRLLTHASDSIREQAARILANKISSNREKIVNDYVAAAAAQPDAEQGRAVFARLCAGCHLLAGQGHDVGPDLAALSSKSRPGLIESILDPNRAVDERYRSYTALTSDGLARAGILVAETSTSVTLLDPQGARHDILRSDIESLQTTGKSLMPEGFENDLTPAQLNDLVAYLVAQVHPPKRVPGNEPTPVIRNDSGALLLFASNCAIYGQQITFEGPFQNIGYWHDSADHLAWDVDADGGGAFVAYLRSACPEDSAGGEFRLADEAPLLVGRVEATGGYDQYRVRRIGRVALPAGRSRLVLRPHGQLAVPNLMDFNALYLVPEGVSLDRALAGEKPPADLDAPAAIADLSAGLKPGDPAQYQRIPRIFEHALAAGQRNDDYEAARVLDLALPKQDARLADWQAVVMGGVINGLSQRGLSPQQRIAELGEVNPRIAADWPRLIQLAATMADNPDVRTGTRYDALRILGTGPWDVVARQLSSYLAADAHPELQMGAVSSVGECDDPAAIEAIINAFNGLNDENRRLAAAALLRTKDRTQLFAQAIRDGRISRELLTAEEAAKLQEVLERGNDGRR